MNDDDMETLDRLVIAVRVYYEAQANQVPVCAQLARGTTRSSALRDLLLAWKHGNADGVFSRDLTVPSQERPWAGTYDALREGHVGPHSGNRPTGT